MTNIRYVPSLLFILRILNAGINRFHTSLWQKWLEQTIAMATTGFMWRPLVQRALLNSNEPGIARLQIDRGGRQVQIQIPRRSQIQKYRVVWGAVQPDDEPTFQASPSLCCFKVAATATNNTLPVTKIPPPAVSNLKMAALACPWCLAPNHSKIEDSSPPSWFPWGPGTVGEEEI